MSREKVLPFGSLARQSFDEPFLWSDLGYNHIMVNTRSLELLDSARDLLAHPLDFDSFLSKLAPKDRVNAERRVTVLEAEPDLSRLRLWRRLACSLMTLAPHAAKLVGRQAVQYYVADGRYRMQVFALEDLQDGHFTVYCPDVLQEALQAGLLADEEVAEPHFRRLASGEMLYVELMDKSSLNPSAHFKDMVGWNRKALRIVVPPSASFAQVEATELLCAIAALHFAPIVPGAAPQRHVPTPK